MRALDKKLLRDLWRLKWQAAAVALLAACGVAVGVMAASTQKAMVVARDRYYAEARFADVFVTLERAPLAVARQAAAIPGVAEVDPRAARAGLILGRGAGRPASVRLISLPEPGRRGLNRVVLISGRMPAPEATDEAVALKTYLDAARAPLGQRLVATVEGRRVELRIVGAVLSPEYVYLPAPESGLPDEAHQAVLWAPRAAVDRAMGLGGAFSSLALRLEPGAALPDVLRRLDALLQPYGAAPAIGRADQVSDRFQVDRIRRLGVLAAVIPPVFQLVAAALVHLILGRLVEAEREQIGLLKAFGYSDLAAAQVYLKMAGVIAVAGAAAGGLFGAWLTGALTDEVGAFLRFPRLEHQFVWSSFFIAVSVAILSALAGASVAARRAARLAPAVAMRPIAPVVFRRGLLEALPVWRVLDQPSRMIARSLERFTARAALTAAGLAVSLSLLVASHFLFDSLDTLVDLIFFKTQHWTEAISFAEPRDPRALAEARRMPGVLAAEPVRSAPADIARLGRREQTGLIGLDAVSRLGRPLDEARRPLPFKAGGLLLSRSLADRLGARPGDQVHVTISQGRRPSVDLVVSAVSDDYFGASAYLERRALNRLVGEGDVLSGAQLLVRPDRRPDFFAAIAQRPQVTGVASRADSLDTWNAIVAQSIRGEMVFYFGFACAIGFGVAYSLASTILAERARELATLDVLGFGVADRVYVLIGELSVLAVLAIPLGVLGGVGLAKALSATLSDQDFRLPIEVPAASIAWGLLIYLATVALAALLVVRRVGQLDMVTVLKTRD